MANNKPLLLLDLDRTLLDTDRFTDLVARQVFTLTGTRHNPRHYHNGDGCNYEAFTAAMETPPCLFEQAVRRAAKTSLLTLLYPDVWPLLSRPGRVADTSIDIAILTFGNTQYQKLKISSLPPLTPLPAHITQEPKRDYIARNFPNRAGWLVDDKPNQNLPDGWGEIHLDRGDRQLVFGPKRAAPGTARICGLGQIGAAIRALQPGGGVPLLAPATATAAR